MNSEYECAGGFVGDSATRVRSAVATDMLGCGGMTCTAPRHEMGIWAACTAPRNPTALPAAHIPLSPLCERPSFRETRSVWRNLQQKLGTLGAEGSAGYMWGWRASQGLMGRNYNFFVLLAVRNLGSIIRETNCTVYKVFHFQHFQMK